MPQRSCRGERHHQCRAWENDRFLYLSGREVSTGEYIRNSNSCSMCKRMIINAGIETVYVRDDEDHYRRIEVKDWIENDESLDGALGY